MSLSPPDPDETEDVLAPRAAELTVGRKLEGSRLDQFLAGQLSDFSRSVIQKAIEAGGVTVNGAPAKASYKVRADDHVRLTLPEPTHPLPVPEDIPLEVLYEDEYLALINKPP